MQIFLTSSISDTGRHIGKLLNKDKILKLAFITTAAEAESGDKEWLDLDRQGLIDGGFVVSDYTITGKTPEMIEHDLNDFDVIHLNGGNSFYLLLQIQKSGFNVWIKEALRNGKIYIGSSAGSIVAAPNIEIARVLDSQIYKNELQCLDGLGIVDIIALPHWGSDSFKDLYLNHRLEQAYKPENKIVLLNDYQYLHILNGLIEFIDAGIDRIVS